MARWIHAVMGGLVCAVGASACVVKTDDVARFKEPIPQTSDVALAIPGSASAGGTAGKSEGIDIRDMTGGNGGYAQFYQFTRDVSDAVDLVTGYVVTVVLLITSYPPTKVTEKQAVWGPGQGNALDPVMWRFTVNEIGDREYDYVLEGRPHLSTNEADWKPIWTGHGWGKTHPNHRSGTITVDNDAYKQLDPARGGEGGVYALDFDLRAYPYVLKANKTPPTHGADYFDITVTHQQDASGAVDIQALGDANVPKDGKSEDIVLHSKWNSTGAGRADVQISGGSFSQTVVASECWANTFTRSYYSDTVSWQPTTGDMSLCAFGKAQF